MSKEQFELNEDSEFSSEDSAVMGQPAGKTGLFQVYSMGKTTVVGFGGQDIPHDFWIGQYKDELVQLIEDQNCQELAFDFTGVITVPSGLLGLLASLTKLDVKIVIFNPSEDIREVLETTNLNQLFEIREIDLET